MTAYAESTNWLDNILLCRYRAKAQDFDTLHIINNMHKSSLNPSNQIRHIRKQTQSLACIDRPSIFHLSTQVDPFMPPFFGFS